MTSLRRCSVVVVALLVAAACGGGDDDDSGGGGDGGGGDSRPRVAVPDRRDRRAGASAKPVEITYWHSLPEENERLLTELTDDVQRVAGRRAGEAREPDELQRHAHCVPGRVRHRRLSRPRAARGQRDAADDRQRRRSFPPRRASTPTTTTCPTSSRGSSTTSRSRTRSGRCRSTCRTRSSTTTRRCSPRPVSTPTSRRRRSTRSRTASQKIVDCRRHAVRLGAEARPVVPRAVDRDGRQGVRRQRQRARSAATEVTFDNDDGPGGVRVDERHGRVGPGREHRHGPRATSTTTSRSGTRRPR